MSGKDELDMPIRTCGDRLRRCVAIRRAEFQHFRLLPIEKCLQQGRRDLARANIAQWAVAVDVHGIDLASALKERAEEGQHALDVIAIQVSDDNCVKVAQPMVANELLRDPGVGTVAEDRDVIGPDDEGAVSLAYVEAVDTDLF